MTFEQIHGTDAVFTGPNGERVDFPVGGYGVTKADIMEYEKFKREHPEWEEHKEVF